MPFYSSYKKPTRLSIPTLLILRWVRFICSQRNLQRFQQRTAQISAEPAVQGVRGIHAVDIGVQTTDLRSLNEPDIRIFHAQIMEIFGAVMVCDGENADPASACQGNQLSNSQASMSNKSPSRHHSHRT